MTRRPTALVAAMAFVLIAAAGEQVHARQKNESYSQRLFDQHSIGQPVYAPQYQQRKHHGPGLHRRLVKGKKAKRAIAARHATPARPANIFDRYHLDTLPKGNVSLNGVVPELAAFARTIVSACGSKVISAVRNTRVRGSGAVSLHASGRAVDISGNPGCIARHLAGWRGGASNDYHRIRPNHFHISWGGREHGKRFAHYQGRKARRIRVAASR
jgi:hypothetical protein